MALRGYAWAIAGRELSLIGLSGLTENEFALLEKVVRRAADTTEILGRRIVPINAPLAAIAAYRLIKSFYRR